MKKVKDFIKRNYLIIILAICFFAFVPPITNLLVTTSSPIGFITPDNQETWIGFFGSIIGGGATLFGVWWTINDQKEQREKDLAMQYRPYLKLDKSDIQFHPIFSKQPTFEPNENNEPVFKKNEIIDLSKFNIKISLVNTGRGEIVKATTTCTHTDTFLDLTLNEKNYDIMPGDSFTLSFDISLKDYKNFLKEEYYGVEIRIKIIFFDFLNNKYSIEIPIYITNDSPSIQFEEQNDEDFIVYENKIHYRIGEIIR